MGTAARFKMKVRCHSCRKLTAHILNVPDHDEAPRDVDELMSSAFLQRQRFGCEHCDSFIGKIISANQVEVRPHP